MLHTGFVSSFSVLFIQSEDTKNETLLNETLLSKISFGFSVVGSGAFVVCFSVVGSAVVSSVSDSEEVETVDEEVDE